MGKQRNSAEVAYPNYFWHEEGRKETTFTATERLLSLTLPCTLSIASTTCFSSAALASATKKAILISKKLHPKFRPRSPRSFRSSDRVHQLMTELMLKIYTLPRGIPFPN